MIAQKKQFAVFDLDGTLVRWQLYHAIVDQLMYAGHIDTKDYQTVKNARLRWKRREPGSSFKTYENTLVTFYEKSLANLTTDQFDEAVEAAFEKHKKQVYIYSRNLIFELKKKNYFLLAISGSQIEVVERIAEYYGFDDCAGTIYHRSDNAFTGQKTFAAHDKKQTLQDLIKRHDLALQDSVGVGDSESDISMLKVVKKPIAFNPTKGLLDYAAKEGWMIVVERKNVVYELQNQNDRYTLKLARKR